MSININTRRAHNEEALRRRRKRGLATRLEMIRAPFIDWMERNGYSSEQRAAELDVLEEIIENNEDMANDGILDEREE